MPRAGEPAFGSVGNVLVSDRLRSDDSSADEIWIGFNRAIRWQDLLMLSAQHPSGGLFVGGKVVADPTEPLGFRFDPSTTAVGEVVVEGISTTLDRIKANPQAFADNQPFGRWAVVVAIEREVPSR
jgi:hypothetical protein